MPIERRELDRLLERLHDQCFTEIDRRVSIVIRGLEHNDRRLTVLEKQVGKGTGVLIALISIVGILEPIGLYFAYRGGH